MNQNFAVLAGLTGQQAYGIHPFPFPHSELLACTATPGFYLFI